MKRLFRTLGFLLGAIVVFLACGAAFFHIKGVPTYTYAPTPEIAGLKVPTDSAHLARGEKIASLLCVGCHAEASMSKLTGRKMLDLPKEFGDIATYNITQDKEHGIGNWTDGELYYFLRTGIRKDGSWAPIFMPKFPTMADEDLYSVIAWLRSDSKLVQPATEEFPPNQYNFLIKFLSNVAFSAPPLPKQKLSVPDSANTVVFGKYVANDLCACFACHSKDLKTINYLEPEKTEGFYGGGAQMLNFEGEVVPTANITFDPETGIGNFTREQFRDAVKTGKNPRGGPLYYPMFPHTTLTDYEVNAVFDYLQTVPKIKNAVVRYMPAAKQ